MPDSNVEMWNPWKHYHALSRPLASPNEASVRCRKSKAALLEQDLPKLEKLVKRGKGLTKEAVDGRLQKVTPIRRCEFATPLDMRLASHVSHYLQLPSHHRECELAWARALKVTRVSLPSTAR